ncbi:MAG: transglutaminase domain-containing protein, partial [Muribaculaceae bacterium]|nr:transglutaminase domain-containing protein [Muribaculaceae bacterium]
LYSVMNPADSADRTPEFYLENCIRPSLQALEELPWCKNIPEREFKYFVLPLRVNNEAIDAHRPAFYAELRDRVKNLSMEDAILEINHWCHEKATYQPSDGRTHSPLQTASSAIGRCGEESTFGVAALRALGIPARQVYTPRWAHTDDNHAWVEAWADGRWHYLGACEPEAVLNHGWFDAPASRGMLMHARVPGSDYDGPEEVLIRWNGNTDINVTSNYAPVDTLRVKVLTREGKPAQNANVSFRLYNYAEFYPIVTRMTDAEGRASLVSGLGDLLVWANNGNDFGFAKASVGKDREVTVSMNYDGNTNLVMDLDLVPPTDRAPEVIIPAELQAENSLRLAQEDSIRNAYVASFPAETAVRTLAAQLNVDADELVRLITLSRGNSSTVITFLTETPASLRPKAMKLLASLTDKDLSDVTREVLDNSLTAPDIDSPLYEKYILSPRIDAEELTTFRTYFTNKFSKKEIERFRSEPSAWVNYVANNISADVEWYPAQATMSPAATGELRHTSPKSRDIYFVAGARSFGIPARIDPVTGKTQYADNSSRWIDAIFTHAQQPSDAANSNTSTLQLLATPNPIVPDPKYYANFTISKIENGQPQLLSYPDFMENSRLFGEPAEIDKGQYVIVTGQRMADGSVMARMMITNIGDQAVVDSLTVRQDPTGVQIIGSFNSENLFKPLDGDDLTSILSRTGRGYFVVGIIRPGDEPSNHALREIAAETEEIEKAGLPIELLFES